MSGYKLIFLFASVLFAQASFAQEKNGDDKEESAKPKKKIERIEVQGTKSRRFYLAEYTRFQNSFFSSFNDLVDDKDMQVVCSTDGTTSSRIKKKSCQPRFFKTVVNDETQRELSAGASITQIGNIEERPVVQQKLLKEYKRFRKLQAKLLNENPELASTYIKMEKALTNYQEFGKN